MRDRLSELKAGRPSDEGEDSVTVPVDRGGFMQDFFKTVEEIRGVVEKLSTQVSEVKKKHSMILSAPNPDERIKDELKQLTVEIRKNANLVQNKLRSMQQSFPPEDHSSSASVDERIQRTQHAVLSRKFVDVMTQYNEAQVSFRERSKNRIQRQLEITGRITTSEEMEDMLESWNPSIFTSDIILDQVTRQALNEIEWRHKDIIQLESSIRELHDMFMDMAMLVETQGETIENIESNVRKTVDYVAKANVDVKKAVKYQRSTRKKYFILALIVLVIITVLVLILGLSLGLSNKST